MRTILAIATLGLLLSTLPTAAAGIVEDTRERINDQMPACSRAPCPGVPPLGVDIEPRACDRAPCLAMPSVTVDQSVARRECVRTTAGTECVGLAAELHVDTTPPFDKPTASYAVAPDASDTTPCVPSLRVICGPTVRGEVDEPPSCGASCTLEELLEWILSLPPDISVVPGAVELPPLLRP